MKTININLSKVLKNITAHCNIWNRYKTGRYWVKMLANNINEQNIVHYNITYTTKHKQPLILGIPYDKTLFQFNINYTSIQAFIKGWRYYPKYKLSHENMDIRYTPGRAQFGVTFDVPPDVETETANRDTLDGNKVIQTLVELSSSTNLSS